MWGTNVALTTSCGGFQARSSTRTRRAMTQAFRVNWRCDLRLFEKAVLPLATDRSSEMWNSSSLAFFFLLDRYLLCAIVVSAQLREGNVKKIHTNLRWNIVWWNYHSNIQTREARTERKKSTKNAISHTKQWLIGGALTHHLRNFPVPISGAFTTKKEGKEWASIAH